VAMLGRGTEVKQYVVYVLEGIGSCNVICLEGLNKTTENVSGMRKHQRDSNFFQHKTGYLPTKLAYCVPSVYTQ
jgi:hypothetical protein